MAKTPDKEFNPKARFINPYNFVEIRQDLCRRENYTAQTEGRSGSVTCELITKTPLIIPDISARINKGNDHFYYPFMKINGEYTIPGSSIRGPVRSVYETLTNSCFSTIRKDSYITQRSQKAMKPGLLMRDESGKWELYQAERCLIPMKYDAMLEARNDGTATGLLRTCKLFSEDELARYSFGLKVAFTYDNLEAGKKAKKLVKGIWPSHEKPETTRRGYIKLGEDFPEKKFESIFVKKDRKENISSKQIEIIYSLLINTLKAYRNPSINRHLEPGEGEPVHSGYIDYPENLNDLAQGCAIPVWYAVKDGKYKLSPGAIGRFTYENTEHKLVKELYPCSDRTKLCKACALFGMTSQDNLGNYASKVRFGDAHLIETQNDIEPVSCELKELASPHISYLPFYAKHKNNLFFDYDDYNAGIRGRKYYWHHIPNADYYKNNAEKNKRNSEMDLMGGSGEKEVRFTFTVWFDDITSSQLEDLVWTLSLGENAEDSKRCIKLGHGKPFGFGSCKIIINEVKERIFDGNIYKEDNADIQQLINSWEISNADIKKTKAFKQLMTILTFGSVSGKVEYPSVVPVGNGMLNENDIASHQWFSKNFTFGKNSAVYLLPEVPFETKGIDQVVSLPAVITEEEAELTDHLQRSESALMSTQSAEQEQSEKSEDKANRAVLVSKDKVNSSSLKRFEGYTIDVEQEWFDKADIVELSKQYGILLISSSRTDNITLKKILSAKKLFDEVWSYDGKSNTWIKM